MVELGGINIAYYKTNQISGISGDVTASYRYDGNKKRVVSVVDGKTIYNVFDASGALVHIDAAAHGTDPAEKTDYIAGAGQTIARIVTSGSGGGSTETITYLHPDHLGSAQSGSDLNGQISWREQYSPFGETLNNIMSNEDRDGFTGHIRDKSTGLTYMQARYYDPGIGRFTSIDPVGFTETGDPGMFNRYAYVGNDSVNAVDKTGKYKEHIWTGGNAVTIKFPLAYSDPTGTGRTSALAVEAVAESYFSGTFNINGQMIDVTLDIVLTPNGQNTMTVDPAANRSSATGDDITMRSAANSQVGAHEIGHPLGAGDQYIDDTSRPIIGANGQQMTSTATGRPMFASKALPGFVGTVMGDSSGRANDATMTEIFSKPADSAICRTGAQALAGNTC